MSQMTTYKVPIDLRQFWQRNFDISKHTSSIEVAFTEKACRKELAPLYKLRDRIAISIHKLECQDLFSMDSASLEQHGKKIKFLYGDLEAIHQGIVFIEFLRETYFLSLQKNYSSYERAIEVLKSFLNTYENKRHERNT